MPTGTNTQIFGPEEVSRQVKQRVFGQDEHVDKIVRFIHAAFTRSILIKSGIDGDTLPQLSSMLLAAPTASGKTHTIKMIAKTLGMPLHAIDAGSLTGEGWSGGSLSSEWNVISKQQQEDPSLVTIVFIDEVDKMTLYDSKEPSFSPKFDLLKPLEGGLLSGEAGRGSSRERFELDCDRCIFILSGAFTGIDEKIALRLATKGNTQAVFDTNSTKVDYSSFNEDELRAQISLEDVEAWGFPRELVGRFSFVDFMPALSAESLKRVLFEDLLPHYSNMMMGGSISVSEDAADAMVRKALSENYGARSLNQQTSEVFFGQCWGKVVSSGKTIDAELQLSSEGQLSCSAKETDRNNMRFDLLKRAAKTNSSRQRARMRNTAIAKQAKELEGFNTNDISPFEVIGDNLDQYAALLLFETERGAGAYSDAEIVLLFSLLSLLRDWFRSDFKPQGIRTLLGMTNIEEAQSSEGFRSPLDLVYEEIETGMVTKANPSHKNDSSEPPTILLPSSMCRHAPEDPQEGTGAFEHGGFSAEEDDALGFYTDFKSFTLAERSKAIMTLSYRLVRIQSGRSAA